MRLCVLSDDDSEDIDAGDKYYSDVLRYEQVLELLRNLRINLTLKVFE